MHTVWGNALEPVPEHGRAGAGSAVRALRRSDGAGAAPSRDGPRVPARGAALAAGGGGGPAVALVVSGGALTPAQLRVRLQPRASRSEIVGERDGALVVRVTAPPVDGKANAALCALLARAAAFKTAGSTTSPTRAWRCRGDRRWPIA